MFVKNAWMQFELQHACASPGKAAVTVRCAFSSGVAQCVCVSGYLHASIENFRVA